MKTIEQIAAEIFISSGYAICSDENYLNILVKDDISEHWEWNDFSQDTLEGRHQADAIENWMRDKHESMWSRSWREIIPRPVTKQSSRIDRIKYCLDWLRNRGLGRGQQMNNEALQNLGMSGGLYGSPLAQSNIDQSYGRPKYGNDYLEPDRPLTGKPRDYLTGYERSPCRRINFPSSSNQQAEIDAYMDGHSEGMAAGMTLMEQSIGGEESRTGINLDKINRVSDDYRRISDEVEQEIGE